jgi:hypothetical protein
MLTTVIRKSLVIVTEMEVIMSLKFLITILINRVRNDRIKEIMDLDKTIIDRVEEKQLVRSPTKDVRREVAKEDLGMDPTRKKEKRTTTKDLVQ